MGLFGKKEESMDELRAKAKSGDRKAEGKLWKKYLALSDDEIRKLADSGDDFAQFTIADKYEDDENYVDALPWYQISAEQGNDRAQFSLAILYINGTSVKKDMDKGIELLKLSAKKGNGASIEQLSLMAEEGLVEVDGSW